MYSRLRSVAVPTSVAGMVVLPSGLAVEKRRGGNSLPPEQMSAFSASLNMESVAAAPRTSTSLPVCSG